MTTFIYIFLLCFFSMLGEFFISSYGIIIPLTALAIYYITVTQGLTLGIIFAVVTGIIIDACFYRTVTLSPWIYTAVVLLANSWIKKGQANSLFLHLIPGGTTALICTMPFLINNNLEFGFTLNSFFSNITHLITTFILSGILLPVMIILFDVFSEIFEFPLYSTMTKKGYRR